jgi:hypothetical protein
MNKTLMTGTLLSLFLCSKASAQTALPYTTGFDNTAQKSGWKIFRKGDAGLYNWGYTGTVAYSAPECVYHNYPVGGSTATDDWFVSPEFNFSSGGSIDSVRNRFAGFGLPRPGDTVAIYLLTGNPDPALAGGKILLYDYRGSSYMNDNTWRLTAPVTIPAHSGPAYIAFRYYTVVNWLDVRFDNLGLSSSGTGVSEIATAPQLFYYPNPATATLHFNTNAGIQRIAIMDISGKILLDQPFERTINIAHLPCGTYFVRSILSTGLAVSGKLVKE